MKDVKLSSWVKKQNGNEKGRHEGRKAKEIRKVLGLASSGGELACGFYLLLRIKGNRTEAEGKGEGYGHTQVMDE